MDIVFPVPQIVTLYRMALIPRNVTFQGQTYTGCANKKQSPRKNSISPEL